MPWDAAIREHLTLVNGANPHDASREASPLISVIVPVFNEQATIAEILTRVQAVAIEKQLIVVDDCSTDRTMEILQQWHQAGAIQLIRHDHNRGKGAAIRTGLEHARGHFTIIQDADLEYDPQDYFSLLEPLLTSDANVVYGSRYLEAPTVAGKKWSLFRIGVSFLNFAASSIYGMHLTDEATCYKVFPTAVLHAMALKCERFEFCSEVTAKACRMGLTIREVPISYCARSVSEGKKIRYRDGVAAAWALWRWRHWDPPELTTRAPHLTALSNALAK